MMNGIYLSGKGGSLYQTQEINMLFQNKKLRAKVRNYNDYSFGSSTGQDAASALARVRG